MADEQDRAEALDEDKRRKFPPEKPPDAEADGAVGAEPHGVGRVAARAGREEPEELPLEPLPTQSDPDGAMLSNDDPLAVDPGRRDVAIETAEVQPAEEAAMHIVDEDLAGFDSEVDDPALAAAYELDPEVDLKDR